MTNEEAIKHLEALFERKVTVLSAEAMRIAIDSLRAQHTPLDRSRWEGCPACRDGEVIAWDLCNDGIVIENDGKIHMLSGGDWEVEIQFCPKCGRPLTEEAWAETERRINGGKIDKSNSD